MISYLRIAGFKSFKDVIYKPRLLNVICGLNGSGKSSLLQAIRLVQSIGAEIQTVSPEVGLQNRYVAIGTQKDAFYSYRTKDADNIEIDIKQGMDTDGIRFSFHFTDDNSDVVDCDLSTLSGGVPDQIKRLSLMGELVHIKQIAAFRTAAMEEYPYSKGNIKSKQWGMGGENAIAYLAEYGLSKSVPSILMQKGTSDSSLLGQVNSWMTLLSPGVSIHAEKLDQLNKAILEMSFMKGAELVRYKPQNVGLGISYALPLVVALLSATENDILLIENPEAHLHPRGQAEIGRLIALVASLGTQIYVETHSDHVINGIRVAVRKENVKREDVNIAFLKRVRGETGDGAPEEYSVIDNISVDENGELSHYPEDFLEEWTNQLARLYE